MQLKVTKESQASEANGSLWYLLGLRSSLGFRLIVISIFPGTLSPIFLDRANYGGSYLLWVGLILLGHTGFAICILTFGKWIHRNTDRESRPVATLVAFMLAQAVRGSILGFSTVFLGFTDDPKLSFRIFSGGIFLSTVLSVIAISIAVYDQHSNLFKNLEQKSNNLVALQSTIDSRLKVATDNLRQFVQQVVTPRIEQIDQLLFALNSGGDKNNAIKEMQNYVDDELRPLSRQIAHDNTLIEIDLTIGKSKKRFDLPSHINLSISMRPFVTTLLFSITYAAAAQRNLTFKEAEPFNLISTVLIVSYFSLFKWIFSNRKFRLAIGIPIGIALFASAGPLVLYVESFTNILIPTNISIATIFVGIIYGVANLGYTILTSQRSNLISDLTKTNTDLESTISLLRQREWIARRQVGYVMHGSLQSSLNAAVLQLGSSSEPSTTLIESLRNEISQALALVGSDSGQGYLFEQAKIEITRLWAGTIQINWVVDPEVFTQLGKNPATSECLAEVVREAVTNAAKHGSATRIEIAVNVEGPVVKLQVYDNGKSAKAGIIKGLGSELFDDVCSWWQLNFDATSGTTLIAELMLKNRVGQKFEI